MPPGTLHFDGQDYADGVASDPIALGWMEGSPPPADKLIRFEDDDTLSFPKIRWSLSHTRETVPTAAIWRGAGAPRPQPGLGRGLVELCPIVGGELAEVPEAMPQRDGLHHRRRPVGRRQRRMHQAQAIGAGEGEYVGIAHGA
jgi:hypothetical protein